MSDIEYSVVTSDFIKSFDCMYLSIFFSEFTELFELKFHGVFSKYDIF